MFPSHTIRLSPSSKKRIRTKKSHERDGERLILFLEGDSSKYRFSFATLGPYHCCGCDAKGCHANVLVRYTRRDVVPPSCCQPSIDPTPQRYFPRPKEHLLVFLSLPLDFLCCFFFLLFLFLCLFDISLTSWLQTIEFQIIFDICVLFKHYYRTLVIFFFINYVYLIFNNILFY